VNHLDVPIQDTPDTEEVPTLRTCGMDYLVWELCVGYQERSRNREETPKSPKKYLSRSMSYKGAIT
jgi:hypothetical protein